MAGRPAGTTKDPNRRRVMNPYGRLIDFEGHSYNKFINTGYKLNLAGNRLIEDATFTGDRNARPRRGRPPGKVKPVPDTEKVKIQRLEE